MDKDVRRVRDVMHARYSRVDGVMTVDQAIGLMKNDNAQALLVEKQSRDDEHGLVLLTDIARHVLARGRSPERVNVFEIMSKPVLSVPAEMQIHYCARLFQRFALSIAPVEDRSGEIIGMVDYRDLVLGSFDYQGPTEQE